MPFDSTNFVNKCAALFDNIILNTDSYKYSHAVQYPKGAEYTYFYIESRGGVYDKTVMFGLQMFLKRYLTRRITREDVDVAEKIITKHGEPFYRELWDYIVDYHGGKLPVVINAAPEGLIVPTKNVLVTITNTDPKCYWLPGFLEKALLQAVWYPTTVGTLSWHCKQKILAAYEKSSTRDIAEADFKLHDFGARGVEVREAEAVGGCAHLVNFKGTDTVAALLAADLYYGEEMAAWSIPAAEHSTITSWGRDREVDAYRNMINQFSKPGSIYAVVSDSYNIWNAIDNLWGGELRDEVIKSGGTLVVRPDSGDPLTVPVSVVEALGAKFGFTENAKGYKVLPDYLRVIQGDGITPKTLPVIIDNLLAAGWSIDNLAFGMGGGLLQVDINRDTQKFAMKASAICINGEWHDVYKDPIDDQGKRSKKGKLALVYEKGQLVTVPLDGNAYQDVLVQVFRNGELMRDWTFAEVRERAAKA